MSTSWRASRGTGGGLPTRNSAWPSRASRPHPGSRGPGGLSQPPPLWGRSAPTAVHGGGWTGPPGPAASRPQGTPPLRSLWPLVCPRGYTRGPRQPPLRTCPHTAWRVVAPEPPGTVLGCDKGKSRDGCEDTVPPPSLQSPVFGGRTAVTAGRGLSKQVLTGSDKKGCVHCPPPPWTLSPLSWHCAP